VTFLTPYFLFAALGAGVPLVIHFLATRATRGRRFSSLVFLLEIEHSALRWAKLQQKRLLAARVLLILLVALALARPSCGGLADPISTFIVLDISASMGAADGDVWIRAQRAAVEALEFFKDESVGLATAGHSLNIVFQPGATKKMILEEIGKITPGVGRLNVVKVVSDASAVARSRAECIRLVLVSDFQPANWREPTELPREVVLWGALVEGVSGNLGFGKLSLLGIAAGSHGTVEVKGSVRRYGEVPVDSCNVTLWWDGVERRMLLPIQGEESVFSIHLGTTAPGLVRGDILVDDSRGLTIDNRETLALFITERQEVVVVGGDHEERRRITLALDPDGDHGHGYLVHQATCVELDDQRFESVGVIILLAATDPGECWEKVVSLWEKGVGLLLVANSKIMTTEGAQLLNRVLGGSPKLGSSLGPGEGAMYTDTVDYDHPIFLPFREFSTRGFVSPIVWQLRQWDGRVGNTLLSLQGGTPLLVESKEEKGGKALLWLTGLTPPWSDWSSRASFVPLWRRAVGYVSGIKTATSVPLGEELIVDLPWSGGANNLELEFPDGSRRPVDAKDFDIGDGSAKAKIGPFFHPGLYAIWSEERCVVLLKTEVPKVEREASFPPSASRQVTNWIEDFNSKRSEPGKRHFEASTILLFVSLVVMLMEIAVVATAVAGFRKGDSE